MGRGVLERNYAFKKPKAVQNSWELKFTDTSYPRKYNDSKKFVTDKNCNKLNISYLPQFQVIFETLLHVMIT